jgi:Right handed beta helix region
MNRFVPWIGVGVLLTMMLAKSATAQDGSAMMPAGYSSNSVGPFAANLPVALPGRVWLNVNAVDNGLGYSGSYATLGAKTRLFEDYFDGRWLLETQANMSIMTGGFFSNVGIERMITIDSVGADASLGVWWDHDSDSSGRDFNHTFDQVGISGKVLTRNFDLLGNAYIPVGTTDFALGDPTGVDCFLNHSIVLQAGIDSALRGFDAVIRTRPQAISIINGTLDLGGYSYESDLVDQFTGVRVGMGAQAWRGTLLRGEINHDDRFDWTGVLQFAFFFQGRGASTEYGATGRDFERTTRSDHIARYNQELILAINPATGAPYNVYHVENTAAAGGTGTDEARFNTLKDAEFASGTNDIIFVHRGNGSAFRQDQGIVLKNGQYLLGGGVQHILTDANRGNFLLCNTIDGRLPRITNRAGEAVTLANNNTVRGIIIDGSGSNMTFGIAGNGSRNGRIEDVTIQDGTILDGVNLVNITGNWQFRNNDISGAGRDGVHIENLTGTDSQVVAVNNSFSNNGRDGFNMDSYDGSDFRFTDNTANDNARHGIALTNYVNAANQVGQFDFLRHTSDGNGADGVLVQNASGDFEFTNSTVTDNSGFGVHLVDFNNNFGGNTVFDATGGRSNVITGNGLGSAAGIGVELNAGIQRLRISNTQLDTNGTGLLARANNFGTVLDTQFTNNVSVDANNNDGLRFIAAGGATQTVLVENTGAALSVAGNGSGAGTGISFIVENGGVNQSSMVANVNNVDITGTSGSGIFGQVDRNAQLQLDMSNVLIAGSTNNNMQFIFDSNNTSINHVLGTGITSTGSGFGADFAVSGSSLVDIAFTGSSFTGATADNMRLNTEDNSRARMNLVNSTFDGAGGNGIGVATTGTSEVVMNLDSNGFDGNGADGVNILSQAGSRLSMRVDNNAFTTNTESGLQMRTAGAAQIDALLTGNVFNNTGLEDLDAENGPAGRVCLAMGSNAFARNALLTNNGAPVDYVVELDGSTNGLGVPTFNPGIAFFDINPFGTVCEPNIVAQENAFLGLGFPPSP